MAGFIETYGGNLNTMAHSGLAAVKRAEAAGLTIGQIQDIGRREGISFGTKAQEYFRTQPIAQLTQQLSDLRTSFDAQVKAQEEAMKEAQRKYQEDMERMRQLQLESETRQAAGQQSAQVAGPGKSMFIRPGASTRFSRPELQIKSMNI